MERQKSNKFAKESLYESTPKIKIIVKLENIVIIQVNTDELHIACTIADIIYPVQPLWLFKMDQTKIIIST